MRRRCRQRSSAGRALCTRERVTRGARDGRSRRAGGGGAVRATFALLSSTPLADNPDVIDDYFELSKKVLQRQPALLLEEDERFILPTALECGCACIKGVQHREALRAVAFFFEALVVTLARARHAPPQPHSSSSGLSAEGAAALGRAFDERGASVVEAIVQAVAAAMLPRHFLDTS